MKTFTLKIECDNDAFDGDDNFEIARILRELAPRLEHPTSRPTASAVWDINGNKCGRWYFERYDDDDGGYLF